MDTLIGIIKAAQRKAFLRKKPMYEAFAPVGDEELARIASVLRSELPSDLGYFLRSLGYGTLNDEFNFSKDWWNVLDRGQLTGHAVFGQDERGNLYTLSLENGEVHYIDLFAKTYAKLASSFTAFIEEASRRGFNVMAWAESEPQKPYSTGA